MRPVCLNLIFGAEACVRRVSISQKCWFAFKATLNTTHFPPNNDAKLTYWSPFPFLFAPPHLCFAQHAGLEQGQLIEEEHLHKKQSKPEHYKAAKNMVDADSGGGSEAPAPQPMEAEPALVRPPPAPAPAPAQSPIGALGSGETASPTSIPPTKPVINTPKDATEREYAPALGTRIEVLWKITHDDGNVEERWWGAVVQDRTHEQVGDICIEHSDKKIHILLYDRYGEFEEDVSRVAFLRDGVLLDVTQVHDENKGLLDWRVEGETMEQTQLSLNDVVEAHAASLEEAGVPDNADLLYLSGLPAHVQMHMTSGYRLFADGVREMLAELSAKHPEGYVVTESDVREMCAKMQR